MGDSGLGGGRVTRRRLLQHAAAAGVGAATLGAPGWAARALAATGPRVAVFGGGVAGLTVAHELAERGYQVTLFERKALGGKARSIPIPGTGKGGRADLPAEHGFRAVFSFYQNLPDMLKRIPFGTNPDGAYGNLVNCGEARLARSHGPDLTIPISLEGIGNYDLATAWETLFSGLRTLGEIPLDQLAFFARQVIMYFTSSDARRFGQYEYESWWDFVRADRMTDEYRKQLADGLTRNLAAARPQEMSVNSTGIVGESFAYSLLYRPDGPSDRAMNAPSNEAWISPWVDHLRNLGVTFELGQKLTKLRLGGGRIVGAVVQDGSGIQRGVEADFFVSAVPIERAVEVFDEPILAASPKLRRIAALKTEWMNGVIFHLDREVPVCDGHVSYVDSQNALTSISQAQIWGRNRDISRDYGDGRARESFSAIISDWKSPGLVYRKPLWSLPRDQVIREVWEQCKEHLNDWGFAPMLTDDMIVSSWLDSAISYPKAQADDEIIASNDEPLMINTPGSWDDRSESRTDIPNLLLAGDHVRTTMNVATMESACESGKRAAQAILDQRPGSDSVRIYDRWTPPENQGLRDEDEARYRRGEPHILDFPWDVGTQRYLRAGGSVRTVARRKRPLAALRW